MLTEKALKAHHQYAMMAKADRRGCCSGSDDPSAQRRVTVSGLLSADSMGAAVSEHSEERTRYDPLNNESY
ncbi:MAG: hypothetical protein ACOX63_00925 [Christensenellales bacterium]|jgi:hypothetical protein